MFNPMQMMGMLGNQGGNNPMGMIMQMLQGGGVNPQQMMGMFGNDPRMKMAQDMMAQGGNPADIAKNLMQGMNPQQRQQMQMMAQQMGIKL